MTDRALVEQENSSWLPRLMAAPLHLGLIDWLVILHLIAYLLRLSATPDSQAAQPYTLGILLIFSALTVWLFFYHRFFDRNNYFRLIRYGTLLVALLVPYFWLQQMIPVINPTLMDQQLHSIDHLLFGGDASIWLEQFASPFSCIWLGISYYSYYYICGLFILGVLLFCRRQEILVEFGFMAVGAACFSNIMYTVVPALGPYHHLAELFIAPLPEQTIVPLIHETIQFGPLRDVFPSMHTALPLVTFLFSVRHFRWAAVFLGLWLPNIIVSTMFLRYHYLIDVVAGIVLALVLFLMARPVVFWYQRQRLRLGIDKTP
jgi:membrane-associated phospholipid phosphatase